MKRSHLVLVVTAFLFLGLFLITSSTFFEFKGTLLDTVLSNIGIGLIATAMISFMLEFTWAKFKADYEKKRFEEIINEWHDFSKTLKDLEDHLRTFEQLGLDACQKNREDSLKRFLKYAKDSIGDAKNEFSCVQHQGTINIVSSSARGLLGYFDREPSKTQEEWCTLVQEKSKHFKFLLTHPAYAHLRQPAEERESGDIEVEILKTAIYLHCVCGMREDNLRLYRGSPTVFQIQIGSHILMNPYPYGKMAMETLALEFDISKSSTESYVDEFAKKHFNHTWAFYQQPSKRVDQNKMVVGIKEFKDILSAFAECRFFDDAKKFRLSESQVEELDYFTSIILVDKFGAAVRENIPRENSTPFESFIKTLEPDIMFYDR